MYSTHNEGKSAAAERFIRTWKNKIYKYMTSISKNVYMDKLDDIVNKHSNTYRTIKMKPLESLCHGLVISDLKGEEIVGTFCKRELQKTNLKSLELKK